MQGLPLETRDGFAAVGPIADQRMADTREMDPDLVGSPGALAAGQRRVGA